MPIQRVEESKFLSVYRDDQGFEAEVMMNPRDAMVFAHVNSLESEDSLKEFYSFLTENYGGKIILTLEPSVKEKLSAGALSAGNHDARYITKEALKKAVDYIKSKLAIDLQLSRFNESEYSFLTKLELDSREKELSDFKIIHASFINEQKIKAGQYSEIAESEKLNNPDVEHYAIEHDDQIIACGMFFIHGQYAYASDLIVHRECRLKGIAQTFFIKAFEALEKEYPHLKAATFIAGGHGKEGVGDHLYHVVFPTEDLKELQTQLGIYLNFGLPKPMLLQAANRDAKTLLVNGEKEAVKAALLSLNQSQEKDLAAPLPGATVSSSSSVTPVSVFKTPPHNDKVGVLPQNARSKRKLF